jgi:hypothetical protein
MFAQPPQTAKLKSILNQELGPLVAQQKLTQRRAG